MSWVYYNVDRLGGKFMKICDCGKGSLHIDQVYIRISGRCKVCFENEIALTREETQRHLDDVNRNIQETVEANARLSEMIEMERQIIKELQGIRSYNRGAIVLGE